MLEKILTEIARPVATHKMSRGLMTEMMVLECLLPVVSFNLRAEVDTIVTASDACESGGGACFASRLSRLGAEEAERMLEGEEVVTEQPADFRDVKEVVLVISLFTGIGGLEEALRVSGMLPRNILMVEKDPDCRRLLRGVCPGTEILSDIKMLTREKIKSFLQSHPEATGLVAAGGSPCQGISKLSSERQHLEDERSQLFYDAARAFKDVEEEAAAQVMWCFTLLENVVGDDEDIREMSKELGQRPYLVDSKWVSRSRRPRLFWMNKPLLEVEDAVEINHELYDEIRYQTREREQMDMVLDRGCRWKGGEEYDWLCFPTFTRSIPRKKPPPKPAGYGSCSEATLKRWRKANYRYPPYTFRDEFLIETEQGDIRVLNANEREKMMGFPAGHTIQMCKKMPETKQDQDQAEDMRCSAIGNSFHVGVVACLLDHVLWSFGVKSRKGVGGIRAALNDEMALEKKKSKCPDMEEVSGGETPPVKHAGSDTEVEELSEKMNYMSYPSSRAPKVSVGEEVTDQDKKLATQMIMAFIRRQEYRGSDVRLDLGTIYRPDSFPRGTVNPHRWEWHEAHSYPFKVEEHINCLELRAIIHTVEWRCRKSGFGYVRWLHLTDSQVCLAVCVKGRSSSRQLNRLLRKLGAIQVAAGAIPIWAWVETHLNPADEPSRRYEPEKED